MEWAVETRSLTKRYGSRTVAVDGLNLSIRQGEVFGFIGPNGAGKTTTLRMLLGLIRPSSGTARVLGEAPGNPRALQRLGALIEWPAFYPYLSGRDNLRVVARYGSVKDDKVEAALARVKLTSSAGDRFHEYSLGMKQRLGVAATLIKDPALLILDEPTNGLDPYGMDDMRDLIASLSREGRTILFSSHHLGDVRQLCHRVGIIAGGRLVGEGTVADLCGAEGLVLRARPIPLARRCLEAIVGRERVRVEDNTLHLDVDSSNASNLNRELTLAGVAVEELRTLEGSLERVFFDLTDDNRTTAESIVTGEY